MKGVITWMDSMGRFSCTSEYGEYYHSHGLSYKELSEREIVLRIGDSVEFETSEKVKAHITKIERTGIKDMKKKILQGIEKVKELRVICIDRCEKVCKNTDLSHEGKINHMNQAIAEFKQGAADIKDKLIFDLEDAIRILDEQESRVFREKRESTDYTIRLSSTLELLKVSADKMADNDIALSVEQFADDPIAISAIRDILGFRKSFLAPSDNRGKGQATLRKVIDNVKNSVKMLADVKYHESGFPGSLAVNEFYISVPALVMFDMAFVESLNDDCTAEQEPEPQQNTDDDFGFNFENIAWR